MANLSYEERESILRFADIAVNAEGKSVVTLVEDRQHNKDSISVVQVNQLKDFGSALIMTEKVAEELSKIPAEHQNDELPFVLTGYILEGNGATIYINKFHYFKNQKQLESVCAEFDEAEIVEICEELRHSVDEAKKPFIVLGHSHPKIENDRPNNLKIINNLSTQDLLVSANIENNIRIKGVNPYNNVEYKGFRDGRFATIMINHIGDLNIAYDVGDDQKCVPHAINKISNIMYVDANGQTEPIAEYKRDEATGRSPLGVYTNPEVNYDIELTTEKIMDLTRPKTDFVERIDV